MERDDRALDGGPPSKMAIGEIHGEHSVPVGLKEGSRSEVATHCHDVTLGPGGVGQVESGRKGLYRHIGDCVRTRDGRAPLSLLPMRALICEDYEGGIDSLRVGELADPEPPPGTALVKVESAAVNFADTLMVKGEYQVKPEPPFAPGYELAGTVVVANQAPGLSPGDRVSGFTYYGALAEKAVVEAANAARLPDSIDTDVACTLPGGYGTSYHALVDRGRLQEGETLLVLGASGGVGMAAVQIGHILRARVIAAVSSDEKATAARQAGADEIIRYDTTPIREGIAQATDDGGVDVVFDPVGGDTTEQALRSTNWNGRLLVIGFAAGDIPKIPLNLPLLKGNSLVGVFWGRFTQEQPERHRENFSQIVKWASEGKIDPIIQRRFTLDEGAAALQWVADRKAIGRVVVNP